MDKGLIQVYTGDGKGKTTAAIGQGIRAIGSGNKVFMVQFLKSSQTGELSTLKRLEPEFRVFRFERERGFVWTLSKDELDELQADIRNAFEFVKNCMQKKACDVLILDEIMGVLKNELLSVTEIVTLLKSKPEEMEVVLTGRNVPSEILELADYVSDIIGVKHPYQKGIAARKGIEY